MYVHMSVRVCELLYLYVHLVMCGSVYLCAVCVCVSACGCFGGACLCLPVFVSV